MIITINSHHEYFCPIPSSMLEVCNIEYGIASWILNPVSARVFSDVAGRDPTKTSRLLRRGLVIKPQDTDLLRGYLAMMGFTTAFTTREQHYEVQEFIDNNCGDDPEADHLIFPHYDTSDKSSDIWFSSSRKKTLVASRDSVVMALFGLQHQSCEQFHIINA